MRYHTCLMVGGVALTVATLGAAGPVVGAVMVAGLVASTAVDVNDLVEGATGTNFIRDQLLGGNEALYDGLSVATALVGLVGPGGAANLAGKVDDVAEAVTTVTRLDRAGEAVTTTTRAENAVEAVTTGGRVSDAGGVGSAGGKVDDGFGGGSCLRSFTAVTKVLMAGGERQPIEDVAVGDQVVSYDPGTGARSVETVTATWPHADQVVTLTVADGTHVETTASHPWWVESERAYIRTDHLDAGDQLLTSDGASLTVESVSSGQDTQQVYNLTITGPHTYYVGETSILVHNCSPVGSAGTQTASYTVSKPGVTTASGTPYRIDVENPNPGQRPGQLHIQIGPKGQVDKYLYDFDSQQFIGASPRLQKALLEDSNVAAAIARGRKVLGW